MKKNQRGFTHNVALLVLGVFVLGVIGFAGFRVYDQKNSDSAKAASYIWGYLGGNANSKIYACKHSNSAGYSTVAFKLVQSAKIATTAGMGSGGSVYAKLTAYTAGTVIAPEKRLNNATNLNIFAYNGISSGTYFLNLNKSVASLTNCMSDRY